MEEQKEEKVDLGKLKRIGEILDKGRIIQIYPLLQSKEEKNQFMDAYLTATGDRLYERLNDRIDEEFGDTHVQTLQGRLRENKGNQRSIIDIMRSRRREPLRQGASERISNLIGVLRSGEYITIEDREFLVSHLATRGIFGVTTPSEAREEIRDILDKYVQARNLELDNDAQSLINRKQLEAALLAKRQNLANTYSHSHNWEKTEGVEGVQSIRQKLKQEIEEIEALLQKENTNDSFGTIGNDSRKSMDIDQNNAALQQLLKILEQESLDYERQGIEIPETGIPENDIYKIGIDDVEEASKNTRTPQIQQATTDTNTLIMGNNTREQESQEEK